MPARALEYCLVLSAHASAFGVLGDVGRLFRHRLECTSVKLDGDDASFIICVARRTTGEYMDAIAEDDAPPPNTAISVDPRLVSDMVLTEDEKNVVSTLGKVLKTILHKRWLDVTRRTTP
jgi:hypothetical protein